MFKEDYNKENLSSLLPLLVKDKDVSKIREIFDEFNIVDLTEIFIELEIEDALFIFRVLPKALSANIFTYMPANYQEKFLEKLTSNEINKILDNMFSDDIIEFLEEMPANVIKNLLERVSPEQRNEINTLFSYQEDEAGYIMSTDFIELKETNTVKEAINIIKRKGVYVETINMCFVRDKERRIKGIVNLRDLIISNNDKLIDEIMETDIHFVHTRTKQKEVAHIFKTYDITAVPVVNKEDRLIGIITADDILDIIEEVGTEDIHKMSGVSPSSESYLNSSLKEMVKSRIFWLLILFISATFTGYVLQFFEDKLRAVAILSASIPIIMSTSGNSGGQSSTMVIRGIAVDDLSLKNWLIVFKKELTVGILCGSTLFIVNLFRLKFFASDAITLPIAIVISLTIAISLIFSNVVGGLLPLIAKSLRLDPAAMAAPLITTIVDATSLILYFTLAINILGI